MIQHTCQSCGMPIYQPDLYGTDADGYKIEDYCLYCFKNGDFTQDVTMEEMIKLCANYVQTTHRARVIAQMKIQFPTLKRWAKKEKTQNEYHKSINKVLEYINRNIHANPSLEELSQIANISSFHFHRIFKTIVGENLGEYIQRLRLEHVASMLRTSNLPLSELADKSGYNNTQALSKAFKKYFGMPPSVYKTMQGDWMKYEAVDLAPRICTIKAKKLLYIRIIDEYGDTESYTKAWRQLYTYGIVNNVIGEDTESIGISFDDPSITEASKCRFYACISIDKDFNPAGKFGCKAVQGGLYAIFTHRGAYSGLHNLYKNIWFEWLPQSNYRTRKDVFFEKYINNPSLVTEDEILTEIYIPIVMK